MGQFFGNFLESPAQIQVLGCVAVVWLGFTALGAAIGGRDRLAETDHLAGWALVSLLFTLAGVFLKTPFTVLAIVAALGAGLAGWAAWRRDRVLLAPGWGRVLVLGLPLLILASAMQGSQWDEFTDWLVIPRYLLETDAFPSRDNPFSKASLAGYPYSWHFVNYLASRLAGRLLESAGGVSNLVLLFGFALLVVRLMFIGAGRQPAGEGVGWSLAALAVLAATLLNPTFAQKVVLTAYADTASAVVAGTGAVLAWFMLEALGERSYDRARNLALTLGLVLALLVNLKQATLVLMVLIVIAAGMIAVRDRGISLARFLRLVPLIVGPSVVIYLAWRYQLSTGLSARELSVRPIDGWFIDLVPQILARMGLVLAKKGYYLALVAVLVVLGVRGFFRSATPFDRFAALLAMVVLGYNAFLLFAYVATFGERDALRAASYWRYNMHLGAMVVAFAAYAGALAWRQTLAGGRGSRRWAWLPVVLVVAAPFVFATKLRFDREPMTRHFRTVGAGVAALVKPGDGVFNADPTGSGESGAALRYELGERAAYTGQVTAFYGDKLGVFKQALSRPATTVVVVQSWRDDFTPVLGMTPPTGQSAMLRRTPNGWRVVKTWPQPANQ
jgi:hypothetical protein